MAKPYDSPLELAARGERVIQSSLMPFTRSWRSFAWSSLENKRTIVRANRACVNGLAECAKERSNITNEKFRSLHSCKMPALLEFRPVRNLVPWVEQAAQDGIAVEHGHPLRNVGWRHPSCFRVGRLIQEVGRGCTGAGEPVDADVGEEEVAVDSVFRQIGGRVRPLLELLH